MTKSDALKIAAHPEFLEFEIVSANDQHTCPACKALTGMRVLPEDVDKHPTPVRGCTSALGCRCRVFINFRTGMHVIENGERRWLDEKKLPERQVWKPSPMPQSLKNIFKHLEKALDKTI